MKALRNRSLQLILFFILAGLVTCGDGTILESNTIGARSVVALYNDRGCWEESVTALKNMFEWMGYSVQLVDADFVRERGLGGYKLFCVPGGDMYVYSLDLTSEGIQQIRTFMRLGGGYVGICAGSNFAGTNVIWRGQMLDMQCLELYHGTSQGPINEIIEYPSFGMCRVDITDHSHPITADLPTENWILYYWGPQFIADPGADVDVLGRYDITGGAAMLAFEYGQGRAFIIGSHPEIEEDSDRDGVRWGNNMDDQGTDWILMKVATDWCLKKK